MRCGALDLCGEVVAEDAAINLFNDGDKKEVQGFLHSEETHGNSRKEFVAQLS